MRLVSRMKMLVRTVFRRRTVEDELSDEIRFHVERDVEERLARGVPPAEATAAARRSFGGADQVREACRDARGTNRIESLWRDVRHGLRLLRRSPGFTIVAVLSLGLGIGANSAVFSLLDAAVLRPVSYADADRLMKLELVRARPGQGERSGPWSYPKVEDVTRLTSAFESIAAFAGAEVSLTGRGNPTRVRGEMVSASYARTLRIAPIAGRDFAADEDRAPGTPVVLLSEDLWRRQFGADRDLIGRPMSINGLSFTVIGILPAGFRGETGRAELWMPIAMTPQVTGRASALTERGSHWLDVVARLRPEATEPQAGADMASAVARIDPGPGVPADVTWAGRVRALAASKVDPLIRRLLLVLLAAVGLVLLIACLNLGSLLLARAMARQRELAVRLALGASRGALVRQFLTEGVLLAVFGGLAGLLMARGLLDLMRLTQPPPNWETGPFLRALDFDLAHVNGAVVVFAAAVTLLTVVIFGVGPAWHAARGDAQDGLKSGTGGVGGGQVRGRRALHARNTLVVVQLALSLVLAVGAGLMVRSFAGLLQRTAGFDPTRTLTFRVDMIGSSGQQPVTARFAALSERLGGLPGVDSVTVTSTLPLTRSREGTGGRIDGTSEWNGAVHMVDGAFFETLRVPLLRGRLLEPGDREGARRVALVNESMARRYWPGGDPIGHLLTFGLNGWGGKGQEAEIVGIVGDVNYDRLEEPPRPAVYLSTGQRISPSMYLAVRTSGDPVTLVAAMRREVASFDSGLPIFDVQTMEQRTTAASARTRFQSVLLTTFALLALTLATIGVSGVMAYAVSMRTRELGVRLAIGATRGDVTRLIVGQTTRLAVWGLALGLPLAFVTTRLLRGLLYGVTPTDPLTFVAASAVLTTVALAACWRPARRAGRIDPLVALRHE